MLAVPLASSPIANSTGAPISDAAKAAQALADSNRLDQVDRTQSARNAAAAAAGVPGFTPGAEPDYNASIGNTSNRPQLLGLQAAARTADTQRSAARAEVAGHVAQELNEVGGTNLFPRQADFDDSTNRLVGWAGSAPGSQQYAALAQQVKGTVTSERWTQEAIAQQIGVARNANSQIVQAQQNFDKAQAYANAHPMPLGSDGQPQSNDALASAKDALTTAQRAGSQSQQAVANATQVELNRITDGNPTRQQSVQALVQEAQTRIPDNVGGASMLADAANRARSGWTTPGVNAVIKGFNRVFNAQLQADAASTVVPSGATPSQNTALAKQQGSLNDEVTRQAWAANNAATSPDIAERTGQRELNVSDFLSTLQAHVPGQAVVDASNAAFQSVVVQPAGDAVRAAYQQRGVEAASVELSNQAQWHNKSTAALIMQNTLPTVADIGRGLLPQGGQKSDDIHTDLSFLGAWSATSPASLDERQKDAGLISLGNASLDLRASSDEPLAVEQMRNRVIGNLSEATEWAAQGDPDPTVRVGAAAGQVAHALASTLPATGGVATAFGQAVGDGRGASLALAYAADTQARDAPGSQRVQIAAAAGVQRLSDQTAEALNNFRDVTFGLAHSLQGPNTIAGNDSKLKQAAIDSLNAQLDKPATIDSDGKTPRQQINETSGAVDDWGFKAFRAQGALDTLLPQLNDSVATQNLKNRSNAFAGREETGFAINQSNTVSADVMSRAILSENAQVQSEPGDPLSRAIRAQNMPAGAGRFNWLRAGLLGKGARNFGSESINAVTASLTSILATQPEVLEQAALGGGTSPVGARAGATNTGLFKYGKDSISKWGARINELPTFGTNNSPNPGMLGTPGNTTTRPGVAGTPSKIDYYNAATWDKAKETGTARLDAVAISAVGVSLRGFGAALNAAAAYGQYQNRRDVTYPGLYEAKSAYYAASSLKDGSEAMAAYAARRWVRANTVTDPLTGAVSAKAGPIESPGWMTRIMTIRGFTPQVRTPGFDPTNPLHTQDQLNIPRQERNWRGATWGEAIKMQPGYLKFARGWSLLGAGLDAWNGFDSAVIDHDYTAASLYGAVSLTNLLQIPASLNKVHTIDQGTGVVGRIVGGLNNRLTGKGMLWLTAASAAITTANVAHGIYRDDMRFEPRDIDTMQDFNKRAGLGMTDEQAAALVTNSPTTHDNGVAALYDAAEHYGIPRDQLLQRIRQTDPDKLKDFMSEAAVIKRGSDGRFPVQGNPDTDRRTHNIPFLTVTLPKFLDDGLWGNSTSFDPQNLEALRLYGSDNGIDNILAPVGV